MKTRLLIGLIWCLSAFGITNANADSSFKSTEHLSIQLYHDGKDEVLARFSMQPDWHIAWSNPGDVGQATTITAENSGLKILGQSVPKARRIYDIMNEYLYENTAYYLLQVNNLNEGKITFDFVECNDVCKPETVSFRLGQIAQTSETEWKKLKQTAVATFPQKITLSGRTGDTFLNLDFLNQVPTDFIPTQKDVIDESTIKINSSDNEIKVEWDAENNQQLKQALLLTENDAYLADIEYKNGISKLLLYMMFLAFIGGILLNAMPCVFPILSLKILTLIKSPQTGSGTWKNALNYTLGVIFSFWCLTLCLVWLKQSGESIGWGFQLQSPWFVGVMALLFGVMFLFMIDILKFPTIAADLLHRLSGINEFSTGFFAVLIASPCSGPFMGAAIGYAFTRSDFEIFAVFTALAVGYALPYALIEMFPRLLHRILPKPGAWMQKLKHILAIPVLLTAIWLSAVLYNQLTDIADETIVSNELNWQPFDAEKIELLNAQNENIFVDFTADWCLTCQLNEKMLLNSRRFKKFVQQNNVHLFIADLTEYNAAYSEALNRYGRDAIPLYVYYNQGNYTILPLFFRVSSLPNQD